jgi:hypothetical protein
MKATKEIVEKIESCLNNGQTLESVAKFLRKEALKDNGSARLKYPNHGFNLMYTTNENYAQGVKNGYGPGLYAELQLVGMVNTVKLPQI